MPYVKKTPAEPILEVLPELEPVKVPITTPDEIALLRKQYAEMKGERDKLASKNEDYEQQLKTQTNTNIAQHNVRIRNFASTVDGAAFVVDKTLLHWQIQAHRLDTAEPWDGEMVIPVAGSEPIRVVFKNGLFVTNDPVLAGRFPFQSGVESVTPHEAGK